MKSGIERLRKVKKLPSLDKYLIFTFSCLIIYTIVIIIVQSITEQTFDVLTTCFYAAFGGEVLLCARIKKYKLRREDSNG